MEFTDLPTWVLSSAAVRSRQMLQAHLGASGANGYQFRCLSVLADRDGLSQTELGAAAALDPRDVTHTVRALEERGAVSRVKDPSHGRRQLVTLTAAGREEVSRLGDVMAEVQDRVFAGFTVAERATLLELLDRVGRAPGH
ncbi:MarR family winged helix-turn-helix transcriptional regulator [Microbacterium gorillae]|uniref:MarR family winged helix-turn-helix transcriptional regulator n=1 Tax=Microbacterium gorillae TaxID=1231063 RepID=UPI000B1F4DDC|nr:MarR family winged helix-turn-helix transcriptional regulator [Microbacterium gorillae]